MITHLSKEEYPPYFQVYLDLVEEDILMELKNQFLSYPSFLLNIPKEKELYRYGPDKWTIKEVIGHNTDTERVLAYRALCIARNEKANLPGFDEDAYVAATDFNARDMSELINDFEITRMSTISLFNSLSPLELKRIGTASQKHVSVRALFYFIIGHIRHHKNILKERYL